MSPFKVREILNKYQEYWIKREKLEKQLINLSGRDLEKEMWILQRLEKLGKPMDFVHNAVYGNDGILTERQASMADYRMNGKTIQQIGNIFSITRATVDGTLWRVCEKIAKAARMQSIS